MTKPIFIFSAGWRSGSTMLQRLLISSGEIMVWGESGGAINSINDAYLRYIQMLGDGKQLYLHGFGGHGAQQYETFISNKDTGPTKWIACINPPVKQIESSIYDLFSSIYEKPALQLGYTRWGVKEVMANIETASFLKQLWPDSKIIFLIRNPLKCILSIKQRNWMDQVNNPKRLDYYASHWLNLASQFRQSDLGEIFYYEDIISGNEIMGKLKNFTGIRSLDPDFIKTSRTDWKQENRSRLTFFEKLRLHGILKNEMELHGYDWEW